MRVLGLDPSISSTGWGIIDINGNRLSYVADGLSKLFGGQGGLPPAIGEKEE